MVVLFLRLLTMPEIQWPRSEQAEVLQRIRLSTATDLIDIEQIRETLKLAARHTFAT